MKAQRFLLLFLCLISFTCSAAINSTEQPTLISRYNTSTYDKQINTLYEILLKNKNASLDKRVEIVTQYFLGKPYLLGATGEGHDSEFDKGPIYRTDAFDCMTYVEMSLALAEAHNLSQFKEILNRIRYENGEVSFFNRNHFTSLDWNKNNSHNGYIKDITSNFSVPYKIGTAEINKPGWYKKLPASTIKTFQAMSPQETSSLLNKLHEHAVKVTAVKDSIKYIPFTELFTINSNGIAPNNKIFSQIPSGAIIELVYPNHDLVAKIGTHLNVLHMEFAIRTPRGLMFREASSIKHRVVDVPLIRYLQDYEHFTKGKGGINIELIQKVH